MAEGADKAAEQASADLARAYEGLERPEAFERPEARAAYRRELLERSAAQTAFLAERVGRGSRVLEVGTGNGRLLIDLARQGVAASGFGMDLAESRIQFAREWARDEGLAGLDFAAGDVLAMDLESSAYDLVVCITGAFAYFDAIAAGSADTLARRLSGALRPGGLLVLELYPHPEYRRILEAAGGSARLWQELPETDPWRFYLSELALDSETGLLDHHKIFVHRTSGEVDSGRRERLRLYSAEELAALLERCGMTTVEVFEGWTDRPYSGGETMVVTAVPA